MDIKNIVIDAQKTIGKNVLLVDVIPAFEYKNGRRTENVVGYRYEIAMPEHKLEKIGVKIDGNQRMEAPNGAVPVRFDDLELYLYWSQGSYQVAARAKGIHPVTKGEA